jgi:hypothetical protein
MKILLYPFIILSAIGLALSLAVHVASFLGLEVPLIAMGLHGGIFIVWFPAALVSLVLTRDVPRKDYWKAALRGCPGWMKYMVYGFFGYAIINFALFFFGGFLNVVAPLSSTSSSFLRGFSGHWMAFYSMAFAILYSGVHLQQVKPRKCPLGHSVPLSARYCENCGAAVAEE